MPSGTLHLKALPQALHTTPFFGKDRLHTKSEKVWQNILESNCKQYTNRYSDDFTTGLPFVTAAHSRFKQIKRKPEQYTGSGKSDDFPGHTEKVAEKYHQNIPTVQGRHTGKAALNPYRNSPLCQSDK